MRSRPQRVGVGARDELPAPEQARPLHHHAAAGGGRPARPELATPRAARPRPAADRVRSPGADRAGAPGLRAPPVRQGAPMSATVIRFPRHRRSGTPPAILMDVARYQRFVEGRLASLLELVRRGASRSGIANELEQLLAWHRALGALREGT